MTTLSDLSDDLLRRVLFFAPAFEGASTAVLARQWRALWRSSGAVNLYYLCGGTSSRMERQGFLRRAESALAAVHAEGTVVRRFTLHVGPDHNHHTLSVLSRRVGDGDNGYVISSLLSSPVVRLVEELRVIVHISSYTGPGSGISKFGGIYELSNGALPSEALRVLHITNCRNLGLSPGTAFPWLASLRLEGCTILLGHLQGVINAPQLAALHLEWSFLAAEVGVTGTTHGSWAPAATCVDVECYQLRCPAVTDLVLANC